jgi:hypothetical protein
MPGLPWVDIDNVFEAIVRLNAEHVKKADGLCACAPQHNSTAIRNHVGHTARPSAQDNVKGCRKAYANIRRVV